jgi:hypothetical protein
MRRTSSSKDMQGYKIYGGWESIYGDVSLRQFVIYVNRDVDADIHNSTTHMLFVHSLRLRVLSALAPAHRALSAAWCINAHTRAKRGLMNHRSAAR